MGPWGNACDSDSSASEDYSASTTDYSYSDDYSDDDCDRDRLEESFHDMGFYVGMIENNGTELTRGEWGHSMDNLCAS